MADNFDHYPVGIFKSQAVISTSVAGFHLSLPKQGNPQLGQMLLHGINQPG